MKRLCALILALTLAFSFAGCEALGMQKEEKGQMNAYDYIEEAEQLAEEGDLEAAEKLLKKALRKAESEEDVEVLESCLEIIQSMKEETPETEPSMDTTAPTGATVPPETATAIQRPTDSVEQESPTKTNLLKDFDSEEMRRINIFLSNFSESKFQAYPCSDYEMLIFGYKYAKVNNREVLGTSGYEYYISKANMDSILKRFFATTVSVSPGTVLDERNYPVTYRDGAYYYPAADGASVSYCSVATSMVDNGDGTYTVTFNNYAHIYPHESMSPYYSLTDSQAAARSDIQKYGAGIAVVRDYTRSNGVASYQLISYNCL